MKQIRELNDAELADKVKSAVAALLAEARNSAPAKLQAALEKNRETLKAAVRAGATLTGLRQHLEAQGVKCSLETLREALQLAKLWRTAGKTKGEKTAPATASQS